MTDVEERVTVVETEAMNITKIGMQYRMLTLLENHEFSQIKIATSPIR